MAIAGLVGTRASAPAPAPAVDFTSLEGERLTLAELRGKVVLLNFWATDCALCLEEMPAMAGTYRRFQPRGMEAVFIAMPHDRPDRVLHYARSNALPFKVALDLRGELSHVFGIRGTPTAFIIDKRGRIVERIVGAPDFARLHELIERALGERG
ncbi:MAG: TlpA family protein disulfide reductase [Burkholderiales bacterium]|nr:TlpA family protein disulfide reductase [Burkholderiales bacterium]